MWNGEDRDMSEGAGDLRRGVGALETFKKRVDDLLVDFEGSAAGRSKVADQKISRASLSGQNTCFAEADGLYTQYDRVHSSLIKLSRSLGDQIEYLSLGVHAAAVGFDNVEDDIRRRFHEIQTRLYEDGLDPGTDTGPVNQVKQVKGGWAAE
ncbi:MULTISPECIES: hypothetical protein [Streptomyces]|uniref:hypothetical protein n=2 Tax=Streptomyces TaxID=1883 RepID=UPI0004AA01AB|nr:MULTISPECIES: hypothetical protein [Streptomyces]